MHLFVLCQEKLLVNLKKLKLTVKSWVSKLKERLVFPFPVSTSSLRITNLLNDSIPFIMTKVALIVQARFSSSRLPGKCVLPLGGRPMIHRMIERLKRTNRANEIILATSTNSEDEVFRDIASELDISFFAGNLNDVRDRYLAASNLFRADYVVRIPADNPFPDWNEIDRIIDFHLSHNAGGFSSNLAQVFDSGYLDGIGAEIFSSRLLLESISRNNAQEVKEHVHLNFFNYVTQKEVDRNWCPVASPLAPNKLRRPDIVLDVNTLEQYHRISDLFDALFPSNPNFLTGEIIDLIDKQNLANENRKT